MAHVRTEIRARAKAQVTGLATTGSNAFENRQTPIERSALPALNVSLGEESIENLAKSGRLSRQVDLHVDIVCEDDGTLAADLDTILAEVEAALSYTATLSAANAATFSLSEGDRWTKNLIKDITPRAIGEMYDGEGRRITGQARITFAVEYHTQDGTPGTALP
jgi:hypothetical protein